MTELSLPLQLAVIRALEDRVRAAKQAITEQLATEMEPGDSKGVNLPASSTRVGRVTLADGKTTVTVTDPAAFRNWVRDNHPTELEDQVRPAFTERVLSQAKVTGELPPGVDVRHGNPYLSFRKAPGADEAVAALWAEHGLDLLQIEGA